MSSFYKVIVVFSLLFISAAIGVGWALSTVKNVGKNVSFMKYNGPWRVNPSMDLTNVKQRALIAKIGLFALRETEVIYYTALTDSNGLPLSSVYTYELEGGIPDARYWSYTLYGNDDFLIPNKDKIYSYNQESIQYISRDTLNPELENTGQATYKITISNEAQKENWIPSGDNDQLAITLRLYNPAPSVYENLETIPLPTIKRID